MGNSNSQPSSEMMMLPVEVQEMAKPVPAPIDPSAGCLRQAVLTVITPSQKETIDNSYNACMAASQAPAPAPSGTSTYAAEGVPYPIVSGHPTWVTLVSIFAIIGALVLVKK
jgi:hypothetical protein